MFNTFSRGAKIVGCIRQPKELERAIKKKLGGPKKGQAKIWGAMSHPGLSLDSPLFRSRRRTHENPELRSWSHVHEKKSSGAGVVSFYDGFAPQEITSWCNPKFYVKILTKSLPALNTDTYIAVQACQ